MYEIDKIDVKIVNLLLEDGRAPASEIARRLGDISERAVRYRIDRMVEEGVIRANKMAEYQNVSYVACSIGETDVSIQIVAKDTAEVYKFVTEVVRKVPGVRKTTTSIVPIILKDVYQWRVPVQEAPSE
jgi:Lrp/AsnC family transcriptional regulator for asnA, asnC and gidA